MIKRVLLITVIFSMFLSVASCSASDLETKTSEYATFDAVKGQEVMLYDYEELSDFQEINATQAFGVTRMNTDAKYVKSGSGSMYVKVEGYEEMYHHPEKISTAKQVIEMYPNWYFEQRGDFSDVLCFKLDVYNVSDRDVEIGLYIQTSNTQILLGPEISVRNQWTELVFEVDTVKSYYWGMDSVSRFQLTFEGRTEGQTPAEMYIDNFRYVKSDTKATGLGYVPTQEGNVLCDFEDKYFITTTMQTHACYPSAGPFVAPKYEWNTDKNFVTSGDHSLKITRYRNSYQNSIIPVYAENTILTTEYLKQVNLSSYDKNVNVIAVDIFNDYTENVKIRFDIYDGNNQAVVAEDVRLDPKEWTTVEIPMTSAVFNWQNIIAFRVIFDDWFGTEDCVVYMDNIRVQPKKA